MAANTKKKATKPSSSKRSSSRGKNTKAMSTDDKKVLWSSILSLLGIMVACFTIVKGESLWNSIHSGILGTFGVAAFAVPVVLIYASVMIALDRQKSDIAGKVFQGVILILMLCGATQIFSKGGAYKGTQVSELFSLLFEDGKELRGGGIAAVVVGIPLLRLFGKVGAAIIIVLLTLFFVMLIANKTIVDVAVGIRNFFTAILDARPEYTPTQVRERTPGESRKRQEQARKEAAISDLNAVPNADVPQDIAEKNQKGVAALLFGDDKPSKKKQNKKDPFGRPIDLFAEEETPLSATEKEVAAYQKQIDQEAARRSDVAEIARRAAGGDAPAPVKPPLDAPAKPTVPVKPPLDAPAKPAPAPTAAKPAIDMSALNAAAAAAEAAAATPPKEASLTDIIGRASENRRAQISAAAGSPAPVPQKPVPMPRTQGKTATLASDKISDEEDYSLHETTASEIQNEIQENAIALQHYEIPPIGLLKPSSNSFNKEDAEAEMRENADKLVKTLESFGVMTRIVDIHRGPTVTRYELQPNAGVKISRITSLADDIALRLAAEGVRIQAPIPGKAAVGVEIPNRIKDIVTLRDIVDTEEFRNAKSKLTFAVGKNIDGDIILGDIAKLPHVIIAGTTGSGKSVCTNGIIMSILYNSTPQEVRLLLVDPKVVEFKIYDGIPHLLLPVVTDPNKAAGALAWAVKEMEKRYKLFADNSVRDLKGYNELAQEREDIEPIPRIVIVIDELADLMMAASSDVESSICRLAQMARAAGMHLIIATQRPTVDVITGLIKANIPSRIALRVASGIDSRSIINEVGAEKLLGNGDLLYFPTGYAKPLRVQNCYTSEKEVAAVVDFIKNGVGNFSYDEEIIKAVEDNIPQPKGEKPADNGKTYEGSDDDVLERAIECAVDAGAAGVSTSYFQRKLKLGYARAARIMDELEEQGIVGPQDGSKPRQVLMTREMYLARGLGARN